MGANFIGSTKPAAVEQAVQPLTHARLAVPAHREEKAELPDTDDSQSRYITVPTLLQNSGVLFLAGPISSQFKSVQVSTAFWHEQHGLGCPCSGSGTETLTEPEYGVFIGLLLRSSDRLEVVASVAMCRLWSAWIRSKSWRS